MQNFSFKISENKEDMRFQRGFIRFKAVTDTLVQCVILTLMAASEVLSSSSFFKSIGELMLLGSVHYLMDMVK